MLQAELGSNSGLVVGKLSQGVDIIILRFRWDQERDLRKKTSRGGGNDFCQSEWTMCKA